MQHHPVEGPGELRRWAELRGVVLTVHRSDQGDLPTIGTAPVVILGGPYSATARPAWLELELSWLRAILALDAPVLAICLGAQLLAIALGGKVIPMNISEGGWTPLRFHDGQTLDVLQWHEDMCVLPAAAQHATSAHCASQLFSVGATRIGMQFHAEWDAGTVAELNAHFGDASPLPRDVDAERFTQVTRWLHAQLDAWWEVARTPSAPNGATSRWADSP